MSKKKYRRQRQQRPMISIGIGIFLILIAVLFIAAPGSESKVGSSSVVPVVVNFAAPELTLENIHGETRSLADYRNKVVLVNNWATWCPPCKAEMPTLSTYYNVHNAEGFTIVAIEVGDTKEVVLQFVQSYNLKFQVWLDANDAALKAFGNGSLPNWYVIDRTGTVRYAWTGEINIEMFEKYVTPVIAESD